MTEKTLTTVGSTFLKDLSEPNLSKGDILTILEERLGKKDIAKLDLPQNRAVVSLESQRSKIRIIGYSNKVKQFLPKIQQMKSKEQQKSALEMLEILSPKDRDYAVIACDKYLKLDEKATTQDFVQAYQNHLNKENMNNTIMQNKIISKLSETRLMP